MTTDTATRVSGRIRMNTPRVGTPGNRHRPTRYYKFTLLLHSRRAGDYTAVVPEGCRRAGTRRRVADEMMIACGCDGCMSLPLRVAHLRDIDEVLRDGYQCVAGT